MLRRMALDKPRHFCRDNVGERKTGGVKERAKVRFGSFATADYQHKQVHETGGAVGEIHYIFDEKEGAVRTDGRASVAEDSGSIVVRPIVKDTF